MSLGYEQLRALRITRDTPNREASAICKEADCSWDELYLMFEAGIMEPGADRVHANQMHPFITASGVQELLNAEEHGIL